MTALAILIHKYEETVKKLQKLEEQQEALESDLDLIRNDIKSLEVLELDLQTTIAKLKS